ncbi:MAG: transglycosylase SLT domain-containing protein [Chloroflexi bacterium]|nr:transglycosylase SLT domain-containing protein [Chloroflexota bacterium]
MTWLLVRGVLLALLIGIGAGMLSVDVVSSAPHSCPYSGGGPPFAVESFEADQMRSIYLEAQLLAAENRLFPDDAEFAMPALKVGANRTASASATIPAQLLHAISWIESKINQVHINVPYGHVGAALISPDCGYGIMQVTSTIDNDGGLPSRYEALAISHFAYNIAAGAGILAEKWNEDYFPVVGERDPRFIESWYFALWAYNGWVWINHPGNRMFDPARGTYDCDTDKSDYFDYPYQERVLGCVINPPIVDGQRLWEPHPVDLPNIPTVTAPGGPLDPDLFWQSLDQVRQRMSMALPSGAVQAALGFGALQDRTALLGMPEADDLVDELELSSSELTARGAELLIANRGSGLLAWRVLETPSWLEVGFQAGVALGSGYRFTRGPDESRIPIAAAAGGVPEGSHRGRIELEFYYPDGTSERESVAISLDKQGAAFYEAGRPQS